jgi:hypothetical protein
MVGKVEFGAKVIVGKLEFGGDNVLVGKGGFVSIILVDDSPGSVAVSNFVAVSDGVMTTVTDGSIVFVGCGEIGVTVD